MKKISNLAGIVAAAALLCGISACDNSETITMTSAKIEMVGDPIVTDKAAIFQWKDSVANGAIVITRQAPDEEEVTISGTESGWTHNGFTDRVMYNNLLKAGVEYTYRFYNKSDVSSARTTEYTLEKKYSCVERKVKFESISAAGTKLDRIKKEQISIVKSESNGKNYVSIYVDEKESRPWINIFDKTDPDSFDSYYWDNNEKRLKPIDFYELKRDGTQELEYNPSHKYEIYVGKWYPEDVAEDARYYDNGYAAIKFENFDLGSLKDFNFAPNISLNIYSNYDFNVNWVGNKDKKDSKYEISFEAFDNQGNAVALKKSTVAAAAIKPDAFYNYQATGNFSDYIDATKIDTVKIVKAILKETAKDGTVYEKDDEYKIPAYFTKYTEVDRFSVSYKEEYNEEKFGYEYYANVTLEGSNLPATAKLYYKSTGDNLYTEVTGGLKKAEGSNNLTAKLPVNGYYNTYYDFRAVVTMDNAKWYDWEEGKTEEKKEWLKYDHLYD